MFKIKVTESKVLPEVKLAQPKPFHDYRGEMWTYWENSYETPKEKIVSSIDTKKLKKNKEYNEEDNVFYNIKYSGLDLSGNRYVLTSKEARSNQKQQEIVNMKFVNAVFYFKDKCYLWLKHK